MKNKFLNKIFLAIVFFSAFVTKVMARPRPGADGVDLPNPGGGAGAVGPGAQKQTPIDMYTTILFIVAVSIILGVYFYQRRKNILAK